MATTSRARALAALALAGAIALVPTAASAHVSTTDGPLSFETGFGTEPAYTDQLNSVVFILSEGGTPVLDLGEAIEVTVSFGDQRTEPMTLEPAFASEDGAIEGNPGEYRASFVPTQPGKYTFHFTGSYGGTKVDETLTSGPKTFDEVQSVADATFPKVDAPSNEQLATRIAQDAQRAQDVAAAAASAQDAAKSARTIALYAALIGLVALIAGIAALATRKRA
jgi:hypothetical protein